MPKSTRNVKRPSKERFAAKFGARIRKAREEQGKRLRDIAYLADIEGSVLSKLERGVTVPRLDTADRIARALGISLDGISSDR